MFRVPSLFTLLVLAAAALTLAGCTHDGVGSALSLEDTVQPRASSARAEVMALAPEPERGHAATLTRPAMLSLPDGGAAGVVRTRAYADGLRQDIALDGARVPLVTNGITLLARTAGPGEASFERVLLQPPTEPMIRSEIGAALPHVKMQIIEGERSNDYGLYGLALGRVGADTRCLYMWQWIDENRLPRDSGLSGPVSLRVRLCRAGASFDEMAGWVGHLRIDGAPTAAGDEGRILPPEALPARVVRGPRVTSGDRHAGRRRLAAAHQRQHLAEARRGEAADGPVTSAASAPGAPRYLTPGVAAPAAVRAQPVMTAPVTAFGGDLPPEAFAGPRAALPSPRS